MPFICFFDYVLPSYKGVSISRYWVPYIYSLSISAIDNDSHYEFTTNVMLFTAKHDHFTKSLYSVQSNFPSDYVLPAE